MQVHFPAKPQVEVIALDHLTEVMPSITTSAELEQVKITAKQIAQDALDAWKAECALIAAEATVKADNLRQQASTLTEQAATLTKQATVLVQEAVQIEREVASHG